MKLRQSRLMRRKSSADDFFIGYKGGNSVIARKHQFGEESYVNRQKNIKTRYAMRKLVGFSDNDLQEIRDELISLFANL